MTQLAWFGGVALFFMTLIFPIQFERQWITIGWALEGCRAAVALPSRAPCRAAPGGRGPPGRRVCAARAESRRVRLSSAQRHGPIFNWYLYAYGIVDGLPVRWAPGCSLRHATRFCASTRRLS
jgi:hypothetical protein